jgi:hypothetical protein
MRRLLPYSPDEAFVKLCADRRLHSLDRMNKKMKMETLSNLRETSSENGPAEL